MIKALVEYVVKDKNTFLDKVIPYMAGGGIFHKKINPNFKIKREKSSYKISIDISANSLSQFITIIIGMLRYSPNSTLNKVNIIKSDGVKLYKKRGVNFTKPIIGIIIKPSLSYKPIIVKSLISSALKNKIDFIKDDDASEYYLNESKKIKKLVKNLPYFQKLVNQSLPTEKYTMVIPWINGWQLLEEVSKRSITLSHCANLSPQISWQSHIVFSRLAGADLVVVPDPLFDKKFNLNLALNAATKNLRGLNKTSLIISGGVNPERIKEILKYTSKKYHKYIGFAVGSWLLRDLKNLDKNYVLLKNSIEKFL